MKDVVATIIVDTKGKIEEELFRNLDYSRRKNIQRALKSGLYSKEVDSEGDYKKCYGMYAKIISEGGSTPIPYKKWQGGAKEEKWKLFAVKVKNKIIGYYSIMNITKKIYNLDSDEKGIRPRVFASDKKFNDYRVNDYIYWSTIMYGLNNGANFVDLGGYQLKARGHLKGVNHFKEKWGGEIFKFYLEYPWHVAIGRKIVRNVGIFWYLNEILKKRGGGKDGFIR